MPHVFKSFSYLLEGPANLVNAGVRYQECGIIYNAAFMIAEPDARHKPHRVFTFERGFLDVPTEWGGPTKISPEHIEFIDWKKGDAQSLFSLRAVLPAKGQDQVIKELQERYRPNKSQIVVENGTTLWRGQTVAYERIATIAGKFTHLHIRSGVEAARAAAGPVPVGIGPTSPVPV